ncbi:MAG: hypothetical protein ACOY4U_10390 [Pseudomonadota bacterium]
MASYERMVEMAQHLTPEERSALAEWERANLGDGVTSTSDWPGWEAVFARLSH